MRFQRESDVLVIGAGPVGLFAALSLAERGASVEIIDKEWRGSIHSYALALHPETLRLLDEYGLAKALIAEGQRIDRIAFYADASRAGEIDLGALPGNYPFVLVLPQSSLERVLIERLEKVKVRVRWNHRAQNVSDETDGVVTQIARFEKFSTGYPIAHTEWMMTKELSHRAGFLIGADGYHSQVRGVVGADFAHRGAAETYHVFEFAGPLEFPHEGRIVLQAAATNVVWPLAEGRGRWNFQVEPGASPRPDKAALEHLLRDRAPWFRSPIEELHWTATALFERRLVSRFGRGRIWLVGDAAHITGPVGAQSMNVGLREVADLTGRLSAIRERGEGLDLLERFEAERQEEWRRLLGLSGQLAAQPGAPAWSRDNAARILSCLPASGRDLDRLLGQVGLKSS